VEKLGDRFLGLQPKYMETMHVVAGETAGWPLVSRKKLMPRIHLLEELEDKGSYLLEASRREVNVSRDATMADSLQE
jgi:hypothetical protein